MKVIIKSLKLFVLCASILFCSKNALAQCSGFNISVSQTADGPFLKDAYAVASVSGGSSYVQLFWRDSLGSWIPSGFTANGLSAGPLCVYAFDSILGCRDTFCLTIVDTGVYDCSLFFTSIYLKDSCTTNDVYIYSYAWGGSSSISYRWNTGDTVPILFNKPIGTYVVTITDNIYGCKDTLSIQELDSLPDCCSSFKGTIYETDSCKTNDILLSTYVSYGSGSYTYSWSTGATTSSLNSKTSGTYAVTIMDNTLRCLDTAYITVVDDTCDLCSNFRNSNYLSSHDKCQANDVVINSTVEDSTGTTVRYLWSTGATTASLTGRATGTYTLTITEIPTGCKDTLSISVIDSVYRCCTARFSILGDSSASGNANATKTLNSYSYSQDGTITNYTWSYGDGTNGSGVNVTKTYSASGNYTICHYIQTSSGCKDTMCKTVIAPPPGKNLKLSHYGTPYIKSINSKWTYIMFSNIGTTSENAIVEYKMPPGMSVRTSNPAPTSNSGSKLTYNLGTINPGASGTISLYLNIPSSYSIGSVKCDTSLILTNVNDIDSSNNYSMQCDSVVGSYDPNEKIANPRGIGAEGRIDPATKEIGYLIHFQNEGTYKTFNVRVEDEIDPSFDINSLLIGDASYPYRMVKNGRKLTWFFDGLELTPKSQDEAKSQGYFQYTLKITPGMPIGTQLKNTAFIYFDLNPAIVTNTTLHTLKNADAVGGGSSIRNANSDNLDFEATKSGEKIIIVAKDKIDGVEILDMTGRILANAKSKSRQAEIKLESATNAIYIIQVRMGENTVVKKYNFK